MLSCFKMTDDISCLHTAFNRTWLSGYNDDGGDTEQGNEMYA